MGDQDFTVAGRCLTWWHLGQRAHGHRRGHVCVASPVSRSHVMYGVVVTGVMALAKRTTLHWGVIVLTSQVLDCAPHGGWHVGEGTQRHVWRLLSG